MSILKNNPPKILVVMPHFCVNDAENSNKTKEMRSMSLVRSISSLIQQFGHEQMCLDFAEKTAQFANISQKCRCDIYVCTTAEHHLLDKLDILKGLFHHVETDAHPRLLGFAGRQVLKAFAGKYDYYCYMEDDLFINDPLFFNKLAWFSDNAGMRCLLQPNRCEVSFHPSAKKCYIDGDIPIANNPGFNTNAEPLNFSALGTNFEFSPATNPHSGCFFLNAEQFDFWMQQSYFGELDMSWVGPLESAASLGIMKTFTVYKPAWQNANFLEISHFGDAYLQMVGDDFACDGHQVRPHISPMQDKTTTAISAFSMSIFR